MLIAVIFAIFSMGVMRQRKMENIMESVTNAIYPIGMMLLIIGGGGTFKQVLIDGGVETPSLKCLKVPTCHLYCSHGLSQLYYVLRLISYSCCGLNNRYRDTLLHHSVTNVALVVLAIGAGSVILSHVNDAGFWMFREYFGLTIKETFLTWSLLETIISVSGIIFILFISLFV